MRAERRREIEAQMENERAAYKAKKKHNGFFRFIALIFLLTGGAFFFFVYKLNVLPMKYLIPAAVKSMRGIRHLKKITTRMPPEYREDRVNKWLKLYNSI